MAAPTPRAIPAIMPPAFAILNKLIAFTAFIISGTKSLKDVAKLAKEDIITPAVSIPCPKECTNPSLSSVVSPIIKPTLVNTSPIPDRAFVAISTFPVNSSVFSLFFDTCS